MDRRRGRPPHPGGGRPTDGRRHSPLNATAAKLTAATTNQEISRLALEVCEDAAFTLERSYDLCQPDLMSVDVTGSDEGYAYLRSRANSIEGGASETMRNIIAERILGMPTEPRSNKDIPFSEAPQ